MSWRGVVEGDGVVGRWGVSWWEEPVLPVRALPMVVPWPWPLMFSPARASYAVIPPIVRPKASATATTGRFQPRRRARYAVGSP
ncbi:hypothetical protein [Actinacidiphila epipremni]|uniref:Uncharacterized protein n=1 Tax=Actinacidiphila epipremni TaxID=2053013 RepID=A0ABX0ZNE0_9ACTN|nr:hypothetical protein [Actinacidiphila epipremni]NJP44520.1 hypothetical protein [Actinacidiphila epipremni]